MALTALKSIAIQLISSNGTLYPFSLQNHTNLHWLSGSLFSPPSSHFTDSNRHTKPRAAWGLSSRFAFNPRVPSFPLSVSIRWCMRLRCACQHGYGLQRFNSWQPRILPRRIGMWCLLSGTIDHFSSKIDLLHTSDSSSYTALVRTSYFLSIQWSIVQLRYFLLPISPCVLFWPVATSFLSCPSQINIPHSARWVTQTRLSHIRFLPPVYLPIQVICTNHAECNGVPIQVTVTDFCPGGYWCSNGWHHFDLLKESYGHMGYHGLESNLTSHEPSLLQYKRYVCVLMLWWCNRWV